MWLRVISGVVFVPCLIFLCRLGGGWFLFLIDWILVVAAWEFYRLMEAKGINPSKKVGVGAILVLSVLVYARGATHLGFFVAALLVVVLLRELFRARMTFPVYDVATTLFGVLYVGWLMLHLVLLRELPRELGLDYRLGSHIVLYVFLIAWACDTGAFCVGMPFGRHKLLPRVSPGKSVEGAIGGFLCAVGAALLGRVWFVRTADGDPLLTIGQAAALGVVLGVASQLGDLVESLLKRDAHVKDASHTIPGHGGVLDRFDSLLFSAPIGYYYLREVVLS